MANTTLTAEAPEIARRADIALSNLTNEGGMLAVEQANEFIDMVIDEPTIIKDVRTVTMSRPTMEINRIGFLSRVLRPAVQAVSTTTDPYPPERRVTAPNRAQPDLNRITLATKEIIAEIRLPYEVLEDNIERGGMENTILRLIAQRAALDLEELFIQGDVTSGDSYLALMDGALKKFTANVVDNGDGVIDANTFNRAIKSLPTRYRRNKTLMRFYPHMDIEQDYRMKLSSRGSPLGDNLLVGDTPVPVFGVPMKGAALMPTSQMLFTNPNNLIFGIQRNLRLETMRQIQDREIVIVMTCRVAIACEDPLAGVKVINIASAV